MAGDFREDVRLNYIRFCVKLNYLKDVFNNSEKYRAERYDELLKLVVAHTYPEFVEKFGDTTLNEFYNIELWYRYMLIHSMFTLAYSSFESQLTSLANTLEKNLPSRIKIKDISKKGSVTDKYRKYLDLVHNIQNADQNKVTWIQIERFREIRNLIVHNNSSIPNNTEKRQAKIDFLSSYAISIDSETFDFHIREIQFLYDFLELTKTYIGDIVKEVAPVPPLQQIQ